MISQGGQKTRETVTQPATERSHQKPQQWHLSQVSCSSDLHVLQLCPISLASSKLSIGFGPTILVPF